MCALYVKENSWHGLFTREAEIKTVLHEDKFLYIGKRTGRKKPPNSEAQGGGGGSVTVCVYCHSGLCQRGRCSHVHKARLKKGLIDN